MIEINNTTKQRVDHKAIEKIAVEFLRTHKRVGYSLSVAIVGDAAMRRLNCQYRGKDKTTDVLSFGVDLGSQKALLKQSEARNGKYLGEIIINIREAARTVKYREVWREAGWKRQAKRSGRPTASKVFYFLLVHGLLHLIGYNDEAENDRQEMLRLGRVFLDRIWDKSSSKKR